MITINHLLKSSQNPTDKEELFVEFLLASPSYQLAHKLRTVGITKEETKQKPADFKRVLEIYDTCGDIINQSFESWWNDRGRDLLRSNNLNNELIAYPVDLGISTTKLISEFTQFINELMKIKNKKASPVQMLSNKIKLGALHTKLALINDKGRLENRNGKRIAHWRLAIESSLKSKWKATLKLDSKRTDKNERARTFLGMLVSKHLKESLWIAENAARGTFPSLQPIDTGLEFDFSLTYQLSSKIIILSHTARSQKIKDTQRVQRTYYDRKVKPALNRQKLIDTLVEAQLKIERLNRS
jgi:hypothetical protein